MALFAGRRADMHVKGKPRGDEITVIPEQRFTTQMVGAPQGGQMNITAAQPLLSGQGYQGMGQGYSPAPQMAGYAGARTGAPIASSPFASAPAQQNPLPSSLNAPAPAPPIPGMGGPRFGGGEETYWGGGSPLANMGFGVGFGFHSSPPRLGNQALLDINNSPNIPFGRHGIFYKNHGKTASA